MCAVPELSRPSLPQEVETVIEALGNRARAGILRYLAQHGRSTAGDLAGAAETSAAGVHRHLGALENAGLIFGDPPPGERFGRRDVTFSAVPGKARQALTSYADYLEGSDAKDEDEQDSQGT